LGHGTPAILKLVGEAIVTWKLGEMTFGTERSNWSTRNDHRPLPPNARRQRALRGATVVSGAALCAWILCSNFADTSTDQNGLAASRGDKLDLVVPRGDKLIAPSPPASRVYASLLDARFSLASWPGSFANSGRLQNDGNPPPMWSPQATRNTPDILPTPPRQRVAQNVILPTPRPTSAPTRKASLADSAQGNQTASDTPPAKPSIFATVFEKLFGKSAPIRLAYATTDDSGLGVGQVAAARYDQWTAVYDISAHTVYMPDGTQLEAHSGLGSWLDDPNHANEKMRGVTPPNIYDLELREELFHGVRALRMIPEDSQKVFGRAGLLAHSFMLGSNGDSNGCVSFKNYDAFLQAYLDHKIKRLAVVASL
jgi:hypothetical protein